MAHHHDAMPSISSRPSASVRRTPLADATASGGCGDGSAPYGCHTRSRSNASSASQPLRLGLLLVEDEIALARSADRAEPGVGDVLEGGSRRDAAVRISFLGIVDEATGFTDPALKGPRRGAHAIKVTAR